MPAPLSGLTPGYPPLGQLNVSDGLIRGPAAPKSRQECQVLLMVGLPGAGKTYWAEKHRKEYPEKYFNILGKSLTVSEALRVAYKHPSLSIPRHHSNYDDTRVTYSVRATIMENTN